MTTITRTVRSTECGDLVYAVLLNGQPICGDTADKARVWSLALCWYNTTPAPAKLTEWDGDKAQETVIRQKGR